MPFDNSVLMNTLRQEYLVDKNSEKSMFSQMNATHKLVGNIKNLFQVIRRNIGITLSEYDTERFDLLNQNLISKAIQTFQTIFKSISFCD